jgi:hypothetical protein
MSSADSEGYIVVPTNKSENVERAHSPVSSFTSIRHPPSPSLSVSPPPPTCAVVPYQDVVNNLLISLNYIFPVSIRRFLNRYIIWPFFSGIISSFTQTIFTKRRNRI